MALTDSEIQQIQQIITALKESKVTATGLQSLINKLEERTASAEEMGSWTNEEWITFLTPIIFEILRRNVGQIPIREHNHETIDQGGDAFARKGGLLQ